jgi:FtsZ-interacting cell division protein YlmF
MTTKSKAAAKIELNANVALAAQAGKAALSARTMRDTVNDACAALKAAGVTIGKLNECPFAQAFILARFENKAPSQNVKSVILSAFRKAVATGEDYNENASKVKAAAKKKAAKAVTKNDAPKATDAIKPAETKPAETKPAETKPAETKPAEVKVVTKPAKDDDTSIVLSLPRKADAQEATKQLRDFIEKMRKSENKKLVDLASYLTDAIAEFEGLI